VVTPGLATTGDDAALFHDHAPGCYFLVGSGNEAKGLTRPHHHQEFNFDEDALPVAVAVLAQGALDLLEGR
jgi:amidohydrolase